MVMRIFCYSKIIKGDFFLIYLTRKLRVNFLNKENDFNCHQDEISDTCREICNENRQFVSNHPPSTLNYIIVDNRYMSSGELINEYERIYFNNFNESIIEEEGKYCINILSAINKRNGLGFTECEIAELFAKDDLKNIIDYFNEFV